MPRIPNDGNGSNDKEMPQIAVSHFDMPIRCLPPDECSFGTSPSQAANCRPERNTFASLMVAASAVAVMKPMPGIVSSRWPGRVRSMPSHTWLCVQKSLLPAKELPVPQNISLLT